MTQTIKSPFIKGDVDKLQKKVEKKGLHNILNTQYTPKFQLVKLKDIEPLESQREAKTGWAEKMLNNLGGLDMLAFGVLSLAHDPKTGVYYNFDGNGRHLIAQAIGDQEMELPAMVYPIGKKQAAKYFSYNQKKGRRTLSPETIFVNTHIADDSEAKEIGDVLDKCGMFVKGDCAKQVPEPYVPGTCEISYRGISEGYLKIAKRDVRVCKQARDIVYNAFINKSDDAEGRIANDVYWAVLQTLVSFPQVRDGNLNKSFQKYLNAQATLNTQGSMAKSWKGEIKGISGNAGISKILAFHLITGWRSSKFSNGYVENNTRNIKETLGITE